ncbi:MAG: hypothetical protein ACOZBH_04495 [Patescibacteria group bacterium]
MDKRLADKKWRINHLYKIKDKDGKTIQFKLNRAQKEFFEKKHTKNIILKSRQLGFTTLEAIDMLDDALFTRNYDGLLIAHEKEEALDIFDNKIDFSWKNLPEPIQRLYQVDTDRANKIKFGFGDNTFSSLSVKLSGRSGTYMRVHISEFAKICRKYPIKAKEIISGTFPSVPIDGRIDIESTAEGEYGEFYEMFWEVWNRGEPENESEYKAFFFNWTYDDAEINKIIHIIPIEEMDQSNKFAEIKARYSLSDKQITYYYQKWLSLKKDWNVLKQEYPTTPEEAFVSSGGKHFDIESIERQRQYIKQGEKVGYWIFFKEYRPNHNYGIGSDVSEGVGQDASSAQIIDFSLKTPAIVGAYYNDKIAPDLFAYELKMGGEKYGMAVIAVERNNHGFVTLTKLKEIYPVHKIFKEVVPDVLTQKPTDRLGWKTTLSSKPKMLYDLKTALIDDAIEIPCEATIHELRTYPSEDIQALKVKDDVGKHWDRVMALAIAYQMKNHIDQYEDIEDEIDWEREVREFRGKKEKNIHNRFR